MRYLNARWSGLLGQPDRPVLSHCGQPVWEGKSQSKASGGPRIEEGELVMMSPEWWPDGSHFSTRARIIYTREVTVAPKGSQVSSKYWNCSVAKVDPKPLSLQTPFCPAVSRGLETHSFSCRQRGCRWSNDAIRPAFFNSLAISHFSIYLFLYLHIQQMMVGHQSGPAETAVGKIDQIPALVELTC